MYETKTIEAAYQAAYPIEPTAYAQGEIGMSLDELGDTLSKMYSIASDLTSRISPILRDQAPGQDAAKRAESEPTCYTHRAVRDRIIQANHVIDLLRETIERVAL